jgi:GNAT superfamily N-acetyltransferase
MKVETIDHRSPHVETVKALGKANSGTLGFLPEGAFDEYAARRNIIVAINPEGTCVGYCLFRVSNHQAIIAHLCIESSSRKKGVARALINHLKDISKEDLHGISLKCRRDYEASLVWPRFGFVAKREFPGRGRDRKELTLWWFDHNHPTLFTESTLETLRDKLCVALDANVFFDLSDKSRPGYG